MKKESETAVSTGSKTTPRDFFLWLGVVIALYGSIAAFITLLFEYVNRAFPDPLAYAGDPYGGSVRVAMATLIVLVPAALVLLRIIRNSIISEPAKAKIWVRRWALVLTIFIAGATVAIDLITLITTFLGGELSPRFLLKVLIILLVALGVSLHFHADLKGYWIKNKRKANSIGIGVGVLVLAAIVSGFFIIGSPQDIRLMRYDEQKVSDLQTIQYQLVNYWQQKEELPESLAELNDPLTGYTVPLDPQSGASYTYEVTDELSFTLCATFNKETLDTAGMGAYPTYDRSYSMVAPMDENWAHGMGEECFERSIDPERFPPFDRPMPL